MKATGTLHLSAQAPLGVRQKATSVDSNGNGYLDAGERATFTVTVTHTTNRTPRPATFAKVIVDAPAFVGNAPVCALPKGGLNPGKSVTCTPLTWRTTPQDEDAGAVRHTVQARAVLAGGVRTPDSARVKSVVRTTPAAPGIGLRALTTLRDSDRDGAADAGESVRYTFLVSNTGTTAVRRPTLAVTLSSGRRLAVTCPDEALDPGTNVAWVTTVKLTAQDVRAFTLIVKGVATVIDVNGTTLRSPASTSPIRSSVTH